MNNSNSLGREELIASLVSGEVSMDDQGVAERLAADSAMAEEVEQLRAIAQEVSLGRPMRAEALAASADGDEDLILQGFKQQISQSEGAPQRVRGSSMGPPSLVLRIAAGLIVLVAGVVALRLNLTDSSPSLSNPKLYLEGDKSILVVEELPFGSLQWTLPPEDQFSRVSVRAYHTPVGGLNGERTLLAEFEELFENQVQLSDDQVQGLDRIQFIIEVQADGVPIPRQRIVSQER